MNHVKHVMTPAVFEAGERAKVPVLYGNEERWASVRKGGVIRDRNDSLILPLIMLKRTDISKNETINQSFKHDLHGEAVNVVRTSKWSKHNRYSRFSVLTGEQPIIENIVTSPAEFVNVTYEFVIWTSYIEQMNSLIELFVNHNDMYWGNSEDYKFFCNIDSFSDTSEMDVSSERIVKTSFTAMLKGYLLSEVLSNVIAGKKFNARKSITNRKIAFGTEQTYVPEVSNKSS